MNFGFCLWVAGSLLIFASPAASSAALLVELCDASKLDLATIEGAREEASSLFAKGEVTLRWEGNCDEVPRTTPRLARIYVLPRIHKGISNWHRYYRAKANLMGYVLATPGEKSAGVIYVSRQAVEAVASRSGRTSLTEAFKARAMGRVFAHELAHCFLAAGHTKEGILKEAFGQEDLIDEKSSDLFFSPEQMRVLRRRIEGQPP